MGRIIALALVSGVIWWFWRRWQSPAGKQEQVAKETQRLSQCQRCDAMLPSEGDDRKAVANSCEHGDRCPLKQES